MLTEALDRGTAVAGFIEDGKSILITVTDDRTVYLAKDRPLAVPFSAWSAAPA